MKQNTSVFRIVNDEPKKRSARVEKDFSLCGMVEIVALAAATSLRYPECNFSLVAAFHLFKQPVEWNDVAFSEWMKNRHGIFINHVKRCVLFISPLLFAESTLDEKTNKR